MFAMHSHDKTFCDRFIDTNRGHVQCTFAAASEDLCIRRRIFEPTLGDTDDGGLSLNSIIQVLTETGLLVATKIDMTVNDDAFR